jgi:hypothetical protein
MCRPKAARDTVVASWKSRARNAVLKLSRFAEPGAVIATAYPAGKAEIYQEPKLPP